MKARHFWVLLIGTCALTAKAEPPMASASAPIAEVRPDNLFDRASVGMDNLLNSGFQYLGIRYRFGGTTAEKGFDCSGLVRRVFKDADIGIFGDDQIEVVRTLYHVLLETTVEDAPAGEGRDGAGPGPERQQFELRFPVMFDKIGRPLPFRRL